MRRRFEVARPVGGAGLRRGTFLAGAEDVSQLLPSAASGIPLGQRAGERSPAEEVTPDELLRIDLFSDLPRRIAAVASRQLAMLVALRTLLTGAAVQIYTSDAHEWSRFADRLTQDQDGPIAVHDVATHPEALANISNTSSREPVLMIFEGISPPDNALRLPGATHGEFWLVDPGHLKHYENLLRSSETVIMGAMQPELLAEALEMARISASFVTLGATLAVNEYLVSSRQITHKILLNPSANELRLFDVDALPG